MVGLGFGFEILSQLLFKISWVVGFTKSMTYKIFRISSYVGCCWVKQGIWGFWLKIVVP